MSIGQSGESRFLNFVFKIFLKIMAPFKSLDIAGAITLGSVFLYRATCRLRLWDQVVKQTLMMNL